MVLESAVELLENSTVRARNLRGNDALGGTDKTGFPFVSRSNRLIRSDRSRVAEFGHSTSSLTLSSLDTSEGCETDVTGRSLPCPVLT